MLIIEIHVDKHENKTTSTRASKVREDAQTRPSTRNKRKPFYHIAETIKAWFEDRETKSSHTNGF